MSQSYSEHHSAPSRTYIAIDLKSFYASVECVERGLDPLRTHLVVADERRTDKTICLAVSPSLKEYGIGGRARLFEVRQRLREVNGQRRMRAPGYRFSGSSYDAPTLKRCQDLEAVPIIAPPRMAHYLSFSARIYGIYLTYVDRHDIHVYSIDEVFIDATHYLRAAKCTGEEFASRIVRDIYSQTGITATAGVGTNLYIAKVAMDIMAKHTPPDAHGVRVASLNEISYRQALWNHRPLTDFWRIGSGYARKLEKHGMMTMGDIARCSLGRPSEYFNEDLLYRLFGINAELLIDHAWGWEPCTIADIKAYKPTNTSLSSGQVLHEPYRADRARIVVKEMAEALALDLTEKDLETNSLSVSIGYDISNIPTQKKGESSPTSPPVFPLTHDHYGRAMPKPAHGSHTFSTYTRSSHLLRECAGEIFDSIVNPYWTIRRITLATGHLHTREELEKKGRQLDLFSDLDSSFITPNEVSSSLAEQVAGSTMRIEEARFPAQNEGIREEKSEISKEKEYTIQDAIVGVRKKFGKNALMKGLNLEKGATGPTRNRQIGGHAA